MSSSFINEFNFNIKFSSECLKKDFEEFAILLFIESGEGSVEKWGKFPKFDLMF